ncbi:MAG TPA: nuclear transport factor 2 family protein [Pseudomonadales bacterium]
MDEMQRLLDEAAINRVLAQYCRGVDRGDEALIRDAYWPDATDEHGTYKGSGHTFAGFVVKALNAHALATQHTMQQTTVELRDTTAFVESYVLARHKVKRDEKLVLETFGGRYVDRFEKRAGEWRIAHRQVVHDWSKIEPIAAEYPSESFEQGRRNSTDVSYRR